MQIRWIVSTLVAIVGTAALAQPFDPVVYTVRPSPDLETHLVDIEAVVPTGTRDTLDGMLPNWSPGYYGAGDYARNRQL